MSAEGARAYESFLVLTYIDGLVHFERCWKEKALDLNHPASDWELWSWSFIYEEIHHHDGIGGISLWDTRVEMKKTSLSLTFDCPPLQVPVYALGVDQNNRLLPSPSTADAPVNTNENTLGRRPFPERLLSVPSFRRRNLFRLHLSLHYPKAYSCDIFDFTSRRCRYAKSLARS